MNYQRLLVFLSRVQHNKEAFMRHGLQYCSTRADVARLHGGTPNGSFYRIHDSGSLQCLRHKRVTRLNGPFISVQSVTFLYVSVFFVEAG